MKRFNFLSIPLIALLLLFSASTYAQVANKDMTTISPSNSEQQNLTAESELNNKRNEDAKANKNEYRAKAKEAKRVEREAHYAYKQAKKSARMEKRAQKSRKRAEKQNRKAKKAAEKSDKN